MNAKPWNTKEVEVAVGGADSNSRTLATCHQRDDLLKCLQDARQRGDALAKALTAILDADINPGMSLEICAALGRAVPVLAKWKL